MAQTTCLASFGPAACHGVVVGDGGCCHCRGWLSRVVDPGLGCWLSLLPLPLSMRVLTLRFKLVLLMLFVVDTRDRSRDFKFREHCVTG